MLFGVGDCEGSWNRREGSRKRYFLIGVDCFRDDGLAPVKCKTP